MQKFTLKVPGKVYKEEHYYLLFQHNSTTNQLKNSLYRCNIILYKSWFSKNWMCAVRPITVSIVLHKHNNCVGKATYYLLFFDLEVNVQSVDYFSLNVAK